MKIDYFFETHNDIPLEGPGDPQSTKTAWMMCKELPDKPRILVIGCGLGMQSLDLVSISDGVIIRLDTIFQFLLNCKKISILKNIDNFYLLNSSMNDIPFTENLFDMIWSKGKFTI